MLSFKAIPYVQTAPRARSPTALRLVREEYETRRPPRPIVGAPAIAAFAASVGPSAVHVVLASGETILQEVNPLLWTMIAISAAGAIVTFAFLTYAVWKFRDPKARRRRYG